MSEEIKQVVADEALKIAENFLRERELKPFADRNLELGKMFNCPVCETRHRRAKVCLPVYAKNEDGSDRLCSQTTSKGVMGAARFKGRILKHRNKWGLQVLERATKIYNEDIRFYKELTKEDEDKLGKQSLSRALNEMRFERKGRRRRKLLITKNSRKINRGLR